MVIRFSVKFLCDMVGVGSRLCGVGALGESREAAGLAIRTQNGLIGSFYLLFQLVPGWNRSGSWLIKSTSFVFLSRLFPATIAVDLNL